MVFLKYGNEGIIIEIIKVYFSFNGAKTKILKRFMKLLIDVNTEDFKNFKT